MSKVVLHIGTHKTATTTVQDMFWTNTTVLAEHGLIYPRLNQATGHHGLVLNWPARPKVYDLPQGSLGTLAELSEQYAGTDQTLFLSSEEFSRDRSLTELGQIREALSGFDKIEVIVVLRTQWQFLQSIYLEVSKKRLPPRPPQLVKPVIESGSYESLWVDYNTLLDRLETVFAPEEITLMDFDTCRRAEGGIIGHLLRHLAIDLDPGQLELVNNGASNVSPMSLASWAANIVAEPRVAPEWLVDKTVEAMKVEFGEGVKPCLFTREEFRTLKDHFEARNEVLRQRRAAIQPDFALTPATVEGLTLFRNEIHSAYWVRVARRMVAEIL